MNNNRETNETDTIPLELGINWCANWRQAFSNAFPQVPFTDILRGFRIPFDDIAQLASIPQAVAVRSYLSMDDPNDPSTLRLLLVPIGVNAAGQEYDMLVGPEPIVPPESYIFDFTQPCPIQCDVTSPLYASPPPGHGHHKHTREEHLK